jgi:hypothetical protein
MKQTFNPRRREPAMPSKDEVQGTLNMSVGIPIWWMVCFLAGAIWFGGQFLQKVNTMVEGFQEMKATITAIQKDQISGISHIAALQTLTTQHEARLTALELRERRK